MTSSSALPPSADGNQQAAHASDIVVIGMSALFAKANGLQEYWQNICDRVDAVTKASSEWIRNSYDPLVTRNDRLCTEKGGFLHDLARFNPLKYGIMPCAVDGGGPDQYLAIELVSQALADAGYGSGAPLRPFDGERTGLILGYGSYMNRGFANLLQHGLIVDQTVELLAHIAPQVDHETLERVREGLKDSLPPFSAEMCPGLVPNNVTGRVANRLDLMGPNYVVDAACASSLISLHLGMEELRHNRCDLAIVGGVNASTPAPISLIFNQLGALTRADIRPFDAAASGTLLGEGLGILVLKRLRDAEADGDRIYATLKGVGSASDGKALSSVAPRLEGEALAMLRVYGETGIDPRTIGLVEAHGTSIPLGDRTEVGSLRSVFGERAAFPRCALGSVKSMVAHCTTAAGAAGLIKTILALYYKILPPTICEEVNPDLDIESTPFYINTRTRPWIHAHRDHPRRAAVNAFGFGGINTHAILEEYRGHPYEAPQQLHSRWPNELVVLTAPNRQALRERIHSLQAYLEAAVVDEEPHTLAGIAWTLSQETTQACRLAIVAASCEDLRNKLTTATKKLNNSQAGFKTRNGLFYGESTEPPRRTVFLFPGEGSQYADMLSDLCMLFPEVRRWFDLLDEALGAADRPAPSSVIFPPPTSISDQERQLAGDLLTGLEIGPAAVFAASMAMYELTRMFGLHPDAMVGHSSGENSALTASGTVTYERQADLIEKMGEFDQVIKEVESRGLVQRGTLLAVGGMEQSVLREAIAPCGDDVVIAMDNCSNQCILFGPPEEMTTVAEQLRQSGGICLELPFDRAYHTPHFAAVAQELRRFYDTFPFQAAHTAVYSCATCERFPDDPAAMRDLAAYQWMAPVRFRDMIQKLYDDGYRQFIEIGPSANLTAFVTDILRGRKGTVSVATNNRTRPGLEQLQHSLGQLIAVGMDLDLAPLFSRRNLSTCNLEARPTARPAEMPLVTTLPVPSLTDDVIGRLREQLGQATASGSAALYAAPSSDREALDPTHWPLLGTVISRSTQRLICERRFNLAEDWFLEDHVFGGSLSQHQPALTPLPVIPLTFSLEMMAEAASALAGPGLRVVSLHQLRGYRWLALDRGSLVLRVEAASRTPADLSSVEVRIVQIEPDVDPILVFEGSVQLAPALPAAPEASLFALASPQVPSLADPELYRTCMFHGPRLQGVKHLRQWSSDGIEADLRVLPVTDFFRRCRQPRFILDPGLLDAAGQLVGYWISEQWGPADSYCFPFQISDIYQYEDPLPAESDVLCRCLLSFTQEHQIEAQFELLDCNGRLLYRIQNWTDICYQVPRNNFYPCRLNPQSEFLSEPWLQVETGALCRVVAPFPDQFLDRSWGIWKRMLAHLMLNAAEREEWYALPEAGPRRTEWLLGRIAAKDALRQWAWQYLGLALAPVDIQIRTTPTGQPYGDCPALGVEPLPPVSISHSEGYALAAVAPSGQPIGLDLERRSSGRDWEALLDGFSAGEKSLLQQLDIPSRELATLGMWCAKEAAAKALGTGLAGAPTLWEVCQYTPDLSKCWVSHAGQTLPVRIWFTESDVVALCFL
ncbi:polyketide synthase dehydratase domain-containing protein [Cyanobium sp. FGCU-52]|nr:polyketide synthase dehydratase domain-containing protein [Cyanobium sp. FGCU52]